jgi:hypothetical protein
VGSQNSSAGPRFAELAKRPGVLNIHPTSGSVQILVADGGSFSTWKFDGRFFDPQRATVEPKPDPFQLPRIWRWSEIPYRPDSPIQRRDRRFGRFGEIVASRSRPARVERQQHRSPTRMLARDQVRFPKERSGCLLGKSPVHCPLILRRVRSRPPKWSRRWTTRDRCLPAGHITFFAGQIDRSRFAASKVRYLDHLKHSLTPFAPGSVRRFSRSRRAPEFSRTRSTAKSAMYSPNGVPQISLFLSLAHARDRMISLACLGTDLVSNSLLVGMSSLCLATGNLSLRARNRTGISAPALPKAPVFRQIPCTFPADQGIVAETSLSQTPPTAMKSPRAEPFSAQGQSARKSRRFRGALGVRLCAREPETEGSGLSSRRAAR